MSILPSVADGAAARRWTWRLIFERRDLWVGLYWDQKADGQHFYVCPLPTVVLHAHRRTAANTSDAN